ncbi:hypothetical protein BC829DRAFT_418844 [Chytridium lagenaria]|nr:hypothetical protein BC829DRAFT_418844 [Chytridium lagenaria]
MSGPHEIGLSSAGTKRRISLTSKRKSAVDDCDNNNRDDGAGNKNVKFDSCKAEPLPPITAFEKAIFLPNEMQGEKGDMVELGDFVDGGPMRLPALDPHIVQELLQKQLEIPAGFFYSEQQDISLDDDGGLDDSFIPQSPIAVSSISKRRRFS